MMRKRVVLAGAVGADQSGFGTVRDLKGHAVEQLGAVGEEVVNTGNVYVGHANNLPTPAPPEFLSR